MNRTCTWAAALWLIAGLQGGTAHAQPPSDSPAAKSPEKGEAKPAQKAKATKKPSKQDPEAQRERVRRARERVREARRAERRVRGAEGQPGVGKGPPEGPRRGVKNGAGRGMRARVDGGLARGRGHGKGVGRGEVWRRLRQQWPVDAVSPALTAEMRRHARRMAKLDRIAEIAQEQNDDKAIGRVEALLERERARHRRKIEALSQAVRAHEGEAAPWKKNPAGDEEGR